uniref:hypothetical protein n=1 Tax=Falsiroseomonas oryzae TaxID=2766473 RepID=UPI0022EABC70
MGKRASSRRRVWLGRLGACGTWLALLVAPGTAVAGHEEDGETHVAAVTRPIRLGAQAWGMISVPQDGLGAAPRPAVVLLGDSTGPDGRTQLYGLRLLTLGFSVLDADFTALQSDGGMAEPDLPPPDLRLPAALAALRGHPHADAARVGAIGLGEGARGVLAALARPQPGL